MDLPLKKNHVSVTLLRSKSLLLMFTAQQSSVIVVFFSFSFKNKNTVKPIIYALIFSMQDVPSFCFSS